MNATRWNPCLVISIGWLACDISSAQRPDVVWSRAGHAEVVISAELTPAGDRLLSASLDGSVKVWDTASGRMLHSVRPYGYAALSPNGQQFAVQVVGFLGGTLEIREVSDGSLIRTLGGGAFAKPAWSPDGQRIVVAGPSNVARIWNANSGAMIHQLNGHASLVRCAAYSPDGDFVVTGGGFLGTDNSARIWSAATGELRHALSGHSDYIFCTKISPDSTVVATGSGDRSVKLWNTADGSLIRTLIGHDWPVFDVAFSPDGAELASLDIGGPLRIWRTSDGVLLRNIPLPSGGRSVTYSSDGAMLVVGSNQGPIELRSATDAAVLGLIGVQSDPLNGVALSSDGRTIGYGHDRNSRATASRVRARDGALMDQRELDVFLNSEGVVFSPDLESAGGISMLSTDFQVFGLSSGQPETLFGGHVSSIYESTYSPDGSLFATAGEYQAGLWHADGTFVHWFQNDLGSGHHAVAFSPDGTRLVLGDRANVRIYDVATAALLHDFDSGLPGVDNAAFSPDGAYVAVAGEDGMRMFRLSDGSVRWTRLATRGCGTGLQFTLDGRHVVSSGRAAVLEITRASDGFVVHSFDSETGPGISSLTLGPGDRTIIFTRIDATIIAMRNPVWTIGDVDADGCASLSDLALLLSDFGRTDDPALTDLNENGSTDLPDLALMLSNFGSCN